jgi:8-oxo-dGTP pyrophosphatase MutT (NUDIX family)
MTDVRVGVVDVYVIRIVGRAWRFLALQRGPNGRSDGSWETVHGRIEPGETPEVAARRELFEETGLRDERLYSITVNPFYLHQWGSVQLAVVFAAFVVEEQITIGIEHKSWEWLTIAQAAKRFTWPREVEAIGHIRKLLRTGNAGVVEDTLRVP